MLKMLIKNKICLFDFKIRVTVARTRSISHFLRQKLMSAKERESRVRGE